MGMFNEVYYTCPECGSGIVDQTKSGDCTLKCFNMDRVPIEDVDGLDRTICCDDCKSTFVVKPDVIYVRLLLSKIY